MTFDTLDANAINVEKSVLELKPLIQLKDVESRYTLEYQHFLNMEPEVNFHISQMIGIEEAAVASMRPTIMKSVKEALYGIEKDGFHTLGLEEISSWKVNPQYQLQNLKQQAGYAAEVVSTMKENLIAKSKGSDIRTYRADDLPDLYPRNDQYVDKVRMKPDGTIVDRIQTKFVGGNGKEWLSKVMSKDFDKYFNGDVDKLECPKDFYDDVISGIQQKKESLTRQLESVTAQGKDEVAALKRAQLEKLNKLEKMVEKSTVSSDEAMFARQHPKAYAARIFAGETLKVSNIEGLKSGALAAGITFTVSTVDNVKSLIDGEIGVQEMAFNVIEDTASAGALGYGTTFVSTAIAQSMRGASNQLIRTVGGSCLPAAVVSFAVESYDDISDYVQGNINGGKLAYNLSGNAAKIAGSIEGAKIGAAVGSLAGPVGTVAGTLVGGMIGCVVASELYATAVELGAQGADIIGQKVTELANNTIDAVKDAIPDKLDTVTNAFNNFFTTANIPLIQV